MSGIEKLKLKSVVSENLEYPNWAHLLLSCYISVHRQLSANLHKCQCSKYSLILQSKKQSKLHTCH